ncbi:response regulator transcription factor [Nocardioides sp. MAHUQ-72]|uniref:response regulator transcription factor n=1 Tax=unclassified Nocardioides TaxID=2615069 RepID=UPI00361D572D
MDTQHRILVVEDDPAISELIVLVLEQGGRTVTTVETGAEAVAAVRELDPDLVTLDLTLPDADGVELCRTIRGFSDAYIVMITGRSDEIDRLVGLDVGADEYLSKPFSPQELRARVAALLRRPRLGLADAPAPAGESSVDLGGGLVLDLAARVASLGPDRVPLTPAEFDVLVALATRVGTPMERSELADAVWNGESIESDFLIDVHVGNVRRKLRRAGSEHEWVRTVAGTGYQLTGP